MAAITIPSAKESPRIVDGVLYWYAGDTFDLTLQIDLVDDDGKAISIGPDAKVSLIFYDYKREIVRKYESTGLTENAMSIAVDRETTAKFARGKYTYDMIYDSADVKTLIDGNSAVVE